MNVKDISVPEVYKESADFRFFCDLFAHALDKIKYDTENFFDLYDPLRCPKDLLWMLADTVGYKYDDRLPASYNRLVLLYFMSMIYNRGSRDGITLAAETNLAQFSVLNDAKENDALYNRLESTSIPTNSVYVSVDADNSYIDLVYFSTDIPIDVCIEYVRPIGMFLFQHAGVRLDGKTRVAVDARLTDERDIGMSFGPTHVGHYRREDYARLQKTIDAAGYMLNSAPKNDTSHTRNAVWYRNSVYEDISNGDGSYGDGTDVRMGQGYRSLYSLQLSNNENIVKSLIDPIFSIGYEPQSVDVVVPDDYLLSAPDQYAWNLRYDSELDSEITSKNDAGIQDVSVMDGSDGVTPKPAVNPIMSEFADAISTSDDNSSYLSK